MVGSVIGHRPFAMIGSSLGGLLVRDLVGRRFPQCLGFALLAPVVDPVQGNRTLPEPSVVLEDDAFLESLSATNAEALLYSLKSFEILTCRSISVDRTKETGSSL